MNNLEIKHAKLKLELKEVEKQIALASKVWTPQQGETYFYISYPSCDILKVENSNDSFDLSLFELNCQHQTIEQAEAEINSEEVKASLQNCHGARKFVVGEDNHCFVLNEGGLEVECFSSYAWGSIPVYFDSLAQAKSARSKVGAKRILKALCWLHLGKA